MFLSQCENLSPGILKQKNGLLEWHTDLRRVNILNYVGAFGSVCSGDLIFFCLHSLVRIFACLLFSYFMEL